MKPIWKYVLGLGILCCGFNTATALSTKNPLNTTHLSLGMDYLNIYMPANEPSLGIAGLHLTRQFSNGFAFGAGLYGATNGNYSGLFLLGPEISYQVKLNKHLNLFANTFAGTGGGHGLTTQLGNGGTLIISAGAMFPFQHLSFGAGYSIVRVSGGHIHSNQWTAKLSIPLNLLLNNPTYTNTTVINAKKHHLDVMPFVILGLPSNSFHFNGTPLTHKTGLCGLELSELIHNHWLYFLRGSASFYGGYSGYMDISMGGGYELPIGQSPMSALLTMSIGSGGGGAVDLGGGLFYHPEAGVIVHLTHRFNLNLMGGYLAGFSNRYHLKTFLLGLGYRFNLLSTGKQALSLNKTSSHHISLAIGNETYIHAHNTQDPSHAIQLVSIKLSAMLTKHWFAIGESSFAYTGHIPGFATGLIGAGYQIHHKKVNLYAKFLLGAAGGGGIDAKGGFIIKPTIGLGYKIHKQLGVYAQISKLKAIHGNFAPITFGIGLVYHLNLLGN